MEQVNPTRMELIRKRAQIKLAEQGKDLLREKMDAMIQEFFRIMTTVSDSRDRLEAVADSAQRALILAQAIDDPITLKSVSFATKRHITVDIRGKNIMGVPVPIIEKKRFAKSGLQRGYSPIGVSGRIDETAEKFEAELDLIIALAETETALRRLGEEIQMNRRRVNALEQVLIPELKAQAKYIKITIEEREREDLFRLKKVKRMLQRKNKSRKEIVSMTP
jgi:V/A-type H+-transporting ATPase subunit D